MHKTLQYLKPLLTNLLVPNAIEFSIPEQMGLVFRFLKFEKSKYNSHSTNQKQNFFGITLDMSSAIVLMLKDTGLKTVQKLTKKHKVEYLIVPVNLENRLTSITEFPKVLEIPKKKKLGQFNDISKTYNER
jgi:nitrogenase molybdenum-iron protein alpha/beta subunit